jgi:hypothetical protein
LDACLAAKGLAYGSCVYGAEDSGRDFGEGGGMNEIRRYFTNSLESGLSENMRVGVEVVLYESHLAVIEERETDTKAWRDTAEILAKDIHKYEQQIAALTAHIKELTEALEKYGSHSPADGSPICERSKHSDYPCTCGFEAALGGKECPTNGS